MGQGLMRHQLGGDEVGLGDGWDERLDEGITIGADTGLDEHAKVSAGTSAALTFACSSSALPTHNVIQLELVLHLPLHVHQVHCPPIM